MNELSRNRALLTIIAVLLITNVVMLVLYLRMSKSDGQGRTPTFTEKLKNEVGFTKEQMSVYGPKKDAFWNNMRGRFAEIKKTKTEFYQQIVDPDISDSVLESKAEVIGQQQKDLDLFVIRHFKDVRQMCTPEQRPKFDSLLPTIIERMTARPQRKK